MANNPTGITGSPRGISNTLDGFVVESEEITESPVQEDFDDQNGARADEQVYEVQHGHKTGLMTTDPRAILLVTDTSYCVIAPLMQSQKRIITMYEPKPNSKKLAEIKNYPPAPKHQGK